MPLTPKDHETLLKTLEARFEKHMHRHKDVKWSDVQARLAKNPEALESLHQMEETGGEPDVVTLGGKGEMTFVDCAGQSPKGRRSLCFDDLALRSRKENKPKNSAWTVAKEMGVLLLTEDEYRTLQTLGEFDTTTSSWIQTPEAVRKLGGALFCDRRYNTVFTYHNGAESYYAARGFRASLKV